MKKKITLTDEHIALIKAINFEEFDFSDFFSTYPLIKTLNELKSDEKNFDKYGNAIECLYDSVEHLERISAKKGCYGWGIDQWSLFGGTYVLEDIALYTGHYEDYIKGTEEDPRGKRYPEELEEHMWQLYHDIYENLKDIINLVFSFVDKGGLVPGTYVKEYDKSWKLENNDKK